jgi:hypothetical protein
MPSTIETLTPGEPAPRMLATKFAYLVAETVDRTPAGAIPAKFTRAQLLDAGSIGLARAVLRFDGEKEATFPGYARTHIRIAILDMVRKANDRAQTPDMPVHRDPLYRHYQDCIANAYAHGFRHFGHMLKVLQARQFGLPDPAPLEPRPAYMPEPGTPEGAQLAAYYDRPGYKGD